MASISEGNTENFDYENLGETKCKEIVSRVKAHTLVKLQMEQNNTNEKAKTWYEIIGMTLETLSLVTDRFNKGGIADKRRVLSALGSNPIVTDEKCLK